MTPAGPTPRPALPLRFLFAWFGALAVLTQSTLGALWWLGLECHGYETGFVCSAHDAMPAAGVAAVALAFTGVALALKAPPRVRLVAAALLAALALASLGAAWSLASPSAAGATPGKHLDHF